MKRCPLCDFIYEDEQSFCDMDGRELVADSGLLTRLEITAMVPAELAQPRSSWRRRLAFSTVATVILGAVLFLVYYVPTHRPLRQSANYSSTQITTGSPPAQTLESAPPAHRSPAVDATTTASPSENLAPSSSPSPATKRAEKKRKTATAQPVGTNRENEFERRDYTDAKKDSKVTSFLKKTGRILKKPFQF